MIMLIVATILVGIILGRFFKVLVLLPSYGAITMLCLAAVPLWRADELQLSTALFLCLFALQSGYVIGLLSAPAKRNVPFVGEGLVTLPVREC